MNGFKLQQLDKKSDAIQVATFMASIRSDSVTIFTLTANQLKLVKNIRNAFTKCFTPMKPMKDIHFIK